MGDSLNLTGVPGLAEYFFHHSWQRTVEAIRTWIRENQDTFYVPVLQP